MSDYRFEKPVRLFHSLAGLELPSGKTLAEELCCGSPVSLWDIYAPYLIYYRFPLLWKDWNPGSGLQSLAACARPYLSFAARFRDYLRGPKRIGDCECGLWPANGRAVLFLGFHRLFYGEVLAPVAEWLIGNSELQVVVLEQHTPDGPVETRRSHSIFGHFDEAVSRRAADMFARLSFVKKYVLDAGEFKRVLSRAEIDVNDGALQREFKWFFWRECRRLIPQIAAAEHILARHCPALIVSADDADQRCRIYSLLGRKLGIPSLVVQQGLTHKDYPEWKFLSMSEVAAMGEISRSDMMSQGVPSDRITLTGHPGFDRLLKHEPEACAEIRRRYGVQNGQSMVLFASQPYQVGGFTSSDIRVSMMRAIAEAASSLERVHLIVKPHPIEDLRIVRKIFGGREKIEIAEPNSDISLLVKACDVLLTYTSTTALQALYVGKPVLNVAFPDSGLASIYFDSGATWISRSERDIRNQLAILTGEDRDREIEAKNEARNRFVRDLAYLPDGGAARRVGKRILELIQSNAANDLTEEACIR